MDQNHQPENSIKQPDTPRFLFAPDPGAKQLYIIHTQFPLSIIWIDQNQVPARLFVTESELYPEDEDPQTAMPPDEVEILSQLLRDAAEFYRHNAVKSSN